MSKRVDISILFCKESVMKLGHDVLMERIERMRHLPRDAVLGVVLDDCNPYTGLGHLKTAGNQGGMKIDNATVEAAEAAYSTKEYRIPSGRTITVRRFCGRPIKEHAQYWLGRMCDNIDNLIILGIGDEKNLAADLLLVASNQVNASYEEIKRKLFVPVEEAAEAWDLDAKCGYTEDRQHLLMILSYGEEKFLTVAIEIWSGVVSFHPADGQREQKGFFVDVDQLVGLVDEAMTAKAEEVLAV